MKNKFRAWEKNLKEMIEVDDIDFKREIINGTHIWRFFNEVELMQYTGLKDVNDVEMYERDIVKMRFYDDDDNIITEEINIVVLEEDVLMMTFAPSIGYRGLTYRDYFNRYKNLNYITYEVIGNTYENKDLLGGMDNV